MSKEEQEAQESPPALRFAFCELKYGDDIDQIPPSLPMALSRIEGDVQGGTITEDTVIELSDVYYKVVDGEPDKATETRKQVVLGPAKEAIEKLRKTVVDPQMAMHIIHSTVYKLFSVSDMRSISVTMQFDGDNTFSTSFFNPSLKMTKPEAQNHRDAAGYNVKAFEHRCREVAGVDLDPPSNIIIPGQS